MKKLSKLTLCAFLLSVSATTFAESRLVVWEDNAKVTALKRLLETLLKKIVVKLLSSKKIL